jgi:RNA polymerase sigma-70 factor (ECF subfamily)
VTRRNTLVERLVTSPVDEPSTDHVLDEALALLDHDQRELLRLWAWEGLAPREIAVVLGITANAASIRLHRARRELADVLGPRKTTAPCGHSGARTTQEHR